MSDSKTYLNILFNTEYQFNDMYGLCYLSFIEYHKYISALSELRKMKEITGDQYRTIYNVAKHHYKNSIKVKELDSMQPRLIAQKFIGRKDIREQIFYRDGYMCLNCGSSERLELDHIMPISKGGENSINNLQTLCKSCNCKKKDTFKDYRNG